MKRVAISSVFVLATKTLAVPVATDPVDAAPAEKLPVFGDDDSMWGYKPKAYDPDFRPAAKAPVHILPSAGVNAANCKINPWLLMAFLNHAPAASVSQSALSRTGYATWSAKSLGMDFVLRSLQGCKDNQKVKDVFAINYLMEDKPELYKALSTGSTDAEMGYKKYEVGAKKGERKPLVDLLGIGSGKPLSDWSKSKVYINMYKWKVYNGLYNGTPMVQIKRFQDKFADWKKHRTDAAAEVTKERALDSKYWKNPQQKIDEIPHWMPYLPNFFRRRSVVG